MSRLMEEDVEVAMSSKSNTDRFVSSRAALPAVSTAETSPSRVFFWSFSPLETSLSQLVNATRCVKFRFSPLTKESMATRLSYIGLQEDLRLNDDIIDTLLDCANGDLRKAINLMQSARQIGGKELTNDEIVAVAGVRLYFPFVFTDHSHLCVLARTKGAPGEFLEGNCGQ